MDRLYSIIIWITVAVAAAANVPRVVLPPSYTTYELGLIRIKCNVTDTWPNASIVYHWSKTNEPEFGRDTQTLYFRNAYVNHAGQYWCNVLVVQGGRRIEIGAATQIYVQYSPRLRTYALSRFAAEVGQTTEIICSIQAYPNATFFWRFNNRNVTSQRHRITSFEYNSTLRITDVRQADYGNYTCAASNIAGRRNITLKLSAPSIPDAPQDCRATNMSVYTATLLCVVGFTGGQPISYEVIRDGPIIRNPITAPASHSLLNRSLAEVYVDRLSPLSNYTLRVYQKNEFGRSRESLTVLVWTQDGPPLTPVQGGGLDPTWVAIIAGVASGGFLLLLIFIIVTVVVCKRKSVPKETIPVTQNRLNNTIENSSVDKDWPRNGRVQNGHLKSAARTPLPNPPGENNHAFIKDYVSAELSRKHNAYTPSPQQQANGIKNSSRRSNTIDNEIGFVNANYSSTQSSPQTDGSVSFVNRAYSAEDVLHGKQYQSPMQQKHRNRQSGLEPLANSNHLQIPQNSAQRRLNFSRQSSAASMQNGQLAMAGLIPLSPLQQQQQSPQPTLAGIGALLGFPQPAAQLPVQPVVMSTPVLPPADEDLEFARDKLYIRHKLGEGAVSEVWRARAEGLGGKPKGVVVAVKMLKDGANAEERDMLIRELRTMRVLQPHPNVIRLLACCSRSEFAGKGNLAEYLRNKRPSNDPGASDSVSSLTITDLTVFALHVASGMEYLTSCNLMHRDLAARNVLVDDRLTCKISDFGHARDVIADRQYESKKKNRLPIRWMAPESLFDCLYSTKSDVWSFGILLWEIVTLGSSPYPGMSGPDVMELVQMGYRMNKPRQCSDELYAIMRDCWQHQAAQRPAFSTLCHRLAALPVLDDPKEELNVSDMQQNLSDIYEDLPGEKC